MTLIVEDGTGVTNADSYSSVAEYITYAASYGVAISDTALAEIQLRKSMDYIESFTYKGYKEFDTNTLKFTRTGVYIDCVLLTSAQGLVLIKKALYEVALSINAGNDPLAMQEKESVSSDTFGPISVSYNTKNSFNNPRVNLFLNPLLLNPIGGHNFKVVSGCHRYEY